MSLNNGLDPTKIYELLSECILRGRTSMSLANVNMWEPPRGTYKESGAAAKIL